MDIKENYPASNNEKRWDFSKLPKTIGRFAVSALMGLGVATSQIGDSQIETEHVSVEFHTEFKPDFSGGAVLDTPIGDISYPIIAGPLGLRANIKDIPSKPTINLFSGRSRGSLSNSLQKEADLIAESAKDHVVKSLGLLAGSSALTWLMLSKKINRKNLVTSLVAGSLVAGIPAGVGVKTFKSDSLNSPKYDGLLAEVLKNQDIFKVLDKNDRKITEQAGYLFKLLEQIEKNNAGEEPKTSVRILVLSDIHSRNVYPLVKTLVDNYGVNFIIDAGDIVDWGTGFENGFFEEGNQSSWRDNTVAISDLNIPYYFARGNHDSESSTVKALEQIENVKIIKLGKFYLQNGLILSGMADPVFTPDKEKDQKEIEEIEIAAGKELNAAVAYTETDIVVTHNPIAAKQVISGPSLTISGHVHKFSFEESTNGEPSRLVAGTSGGAGLRVFNNDKNEETEQSFAVINIDLNCNITSIDDIRFKSLDRADLVVKHIPLKSKGANEGRTCE